MDGGGHKVSPRPAVGHSRSRSNVTDIPRRAGIPAYGTSSCTEMIAKDVKQVAIHAVAEKQHHRRLLESGNRRDHTWRNGARGRMWHELQLSLHVRGAKYSTHAEAGQRAMRIGRCTVRSRCLHRLAGHPPSPHCAAARCAGQGHVHRSPSLSRSLRCCPSLPSRAGSSRFCSVLVGSSQIEIDR